MLVTFFQCLREHKVPVTLTELLDLINGLEQKVVFANREDFYFFSRCCLVKDEKHFDKYDLAFSAFFDGLESLNNLLEVLIPEEWLRKELERSLTDAEKMAIKSPKDLEELIEQFKKRLEEQQEKHQGGSKWIGTAGTSPFGHSGFNPTGLRIGGEGSHKKSAKVWEKREFRNLDNDEQISPRNMHVALRRLRKFARTGAADQLDIDDTINSTAKNAGLLDIKMVPERHNAVKLLMFFDVGGSMDMYVRSVQTLFNAVGTEFKHLKYYYFHNCIYESVWEDNYRRFQERISLYDVINKYGSDYKLIFVGDAAMAPYEIISIGGSVEHYNEEAGATWLQRLVDKYPKAAWINPEPEEGWEYTESNAMIQRIMTGRMYPMTNAGLEDCMTTLAK